MFQLREGDLRAAGRLSVPPPADLDVERLQLRADGLCEEHEEVLADAVGAINAKPLEPSGRAVQQAQVAVVEGDSLERGRQFERVLTVGGGDDTLVATFVIFPLDRNLDLF